MRIMDQTQQVGLVVAAMVRVGEMGVTCQQLERMTGVPAKRCRNILVGVSRVLPIFDCPEQTPVRWYVVPESQRC